MVPPQGFYGSVVENQFTSYGITGACFFSSCASQCKPVIVGGGPWVLQRFNILPCCGYQDGNLITLCSLDRFLQFYVYFQIVFCFWM